MSDETEIIGPLDIAIQALKDILNPIAALYRDSKAGGYTLDGRMAVDLSRNAEYLKDIARDALRELGVKDEAEIEATHLEIITGYAPKVSPAPLSIMSVRNIVSGFCKQGEGTNHYQYLLQAMKELDYAINNGCDFSWPHEDTL
jgi:hypothetical protein